MCKVDQVLVPWTLACFYQVRQVVMAASFGSRDTNQVLQVSQFEIGLFCLFNTILVQEILIRIKVTTRCKDEELEPDQFEFQGKRILQ